MRFLSCGGELNHHGKPVCDSLFNILGEDFIRVTTQNVAQSRIKLGFKDFTNVPYNQTVLNADHDKIKELISWCDVMDFGHAPVQFLDEAIKQNKIVFIRFERLLKEGDIKLLYPPIFMRYYHKYIKNKRNPNVYFLPISAYGARDLAKLGIKNERVLEWAYCPEFKELEQDFFERKNNKLSLLWCGRLISLKHPDIAIRIARKLKESNFGFSLKIVGEGPLKDKLVSMIKFYNLENEVELCGAVSSDKVREYMLDSDIFLATSDKREGWGVVVNEAMSSGCAVFATKEMGAVPTLIKDGENGFHITPGNEEEVARKITELFISPEKLKHYKIAAYETIKNGFTPEIYAKVFTELAEDALGGRMRPREGLGSKAKLIK